jgi:hypothetical protein
MLDEVQELILKVKAGGSSCCNICKRSHSSAALPVSTRLWLKPTIRFPAMLTLKLNYRVMQVEPPAALDRAYQSVVTSRSLEAQADRLCLQALRWSVQDIVPVYRSDNATHMLRTSAAASAVSTP